MKTKFLLLLCACSIALSMGCSVSGDDDDDDKNGLPGLAGPPYFVSFDANSGGWQGEDGLEAVVKVRQEPDSLIAFPYPGEPDAEGAVSFTPPEKAGAHFAGWYLEQYEDLEPQAAVPAEAVAILGAQFKVKKADDGSEFVLQPGSETEPWASLAAYALWQKLDPNRINVLFYDYEGGTQKGTALVDEGNKIPSDKIPSVSRTHYNRVGAGWYTAGSGTPFDMNQNLAATADNPLKLFAKWTGKTYKATFDLNYAGALEPPPSTGTRIS